MYDIVTLYQIKLSCISHDIIMMMTIIIIIIIITVRKHEELEVYGLRVQSIFAKFVILMETHS